MHKIRDGYSDYVDPRQQLVSSYIPNIYKELTSDLRWGRYLRTASRQTEVDGRKLTCGF
jgi:hypothetical protein